MSASERKVGGIDFDGTLLNNVELSHKCFCLMMERVGGKPITLERYREVCDLGNKWWFYLRAGFPVHKFAGYMVSPARRKELIGWYRGMYLSQLNDVPLRDGVVEGLHALREQGLDLVIWSNAQTKVVEPQLKRLGLDHFFSHSLCGRDGLKGPKSVWLQRYLRSEGIRPQNLVVIGDSQEEPRTAHEIGAWSIALQGGYTSPKRLAASKPHHMVDSWHEIPSKVHAVFANGGPQ